MFAAADAALPPMTQDIEKAKQLVQQAGAEGKTISLGMSSELNDIATEAGAYQTAANAIGMKATLKSVSAANYINFFIDPKARDGRRRVLHRQLRRLRRSRGAAEPRW